MDASEAPSGEILSIEEQLKNQGFEPDKIQELLGKQNNPWRYPTELDFVQSNHPTVNAHAHPATTYLSGLLYKLSKLAKYIPCGATVQDLIEVVQGHLIPNAL